MSTLSATLKNGNIEIKIWRDKGAGNLKLPYSDSADARAKFVLDHHFVLVFERGLLYSDTYSRDGNTKYAIDSRTLAIVRKKLLAQSFFFRSQRKISAIIPYVR